MDEIKLIAKYKTGFTLIEILIALVVIAVLAAIAVPSYQNYVTRSRIAEGLLFADAARIAVELNYDEQGQLPAANFPIDITADMINHVSWHPEPKKPNQGFVDVNMNLPNVGNAVTPFLLFAEVNKNSITWRCISARDHGYAEKDSVSNSYLPGICLDGGVLAHAKNSSGCRSNEEKVTIKGAPACVPKCTAGQVRSTTNPTNCVTQPVLPSGSTSGSSTATNTPAPGSSSQSSQSTKPSRQGTKTCPSGKVAVISKGVESCVDKCDDAEERDPANPKKCKRKNYTATQDPTTHNPCPSGFVFVPDSMKNWKDGWDPQMGGTPPNPWTWTGTPQSGECYSDGGGGYSDTTCSICAGPPASCDLAIYDDTCTYPANVCINKLTNLASGDKLITRRCGTSDEAYNDWYLGTSDDDKCRQSSGNKVLTYQFECTFACVKDGCNFDLNPQHTNNASMYQPL